MMMMICTQGNQRACVALLVALVVLSCNAFVSPKNLIGNQQQSSQSRTIQTLLNAAKKEYTESEVKSLLAEYMAVRKELNADELAKKEKGKVIGGTKGNKILDYVSGAPTKERVLDRIPNALDYDELTKYGYGYLVTPIMDLGGRTWAYKLMGMDVPAVKAPPKRKVVPKLVIDRNGESDPARYTGLKMGQVMDDNVMAEALAQANRKAKEGVPLRPVLEEQKYVAPFSEKRNTGPRQTPDWTAESLDEYGRQMGKAQSWARRAKLGEFIKDPYEQAELDASFQFYFAATSCLFAFAFGRATPAFLENILQVSSPESIQSVAQIPALALALASIGSAVVCSAVLAPKLNRSGFLWAVKGFVGGPLAVSQIRGLEKLVTFGEQEKLDKDTSSA